MNFDSCINIIIKLEGGLVNDKNDPGGLTNMGITYNTFLQWQSLKNKHGKLQDLSIEDAKNIYYTQYWSPIQGDFLPDAVNLCIFDFAVNSGVSKAVSTVQKILNITIDGILGIETLNAIHDISPFALISCICTARLQYVRSLKHYKHFGNGWENRINYILRQSKNHIQNTNQDVTIDSDYVKITKEKPKGKTKFLNKKGSILAATGSTTTIILAIEEITKALQSVVYGGHIKCILLGILSISVTVYLYRTIKNKD